MKKILIVGTVPYSKNNQSRAFDTYFNNFDANNLAQIFSNPEKPEIGHCNLLYQITDFMVLKNLFSFKKQPGKRYDFTNPINKVKSTNSISNKKNKFISMLYKLGKHKNSINYLLRGLIWNRKNWLTKDLIDWVDDFNPELIFISFSDDFFILQIGLFFARKYNIPIISTISDDYYFNNKFSLNPFWLIYHIKYKKLVDSIMIHKGENIYISDKIRLKYDSFFKKRGRTVFVSSDIQRLPFTKVNKNKISFIYAGNLRLGRYRSIIKIADVLKNISPQYAIAVFSDEKSKKIISKLKSRKNINYMGYIKYDELYNHLKNADFSIIAESTRKKDIVKTRYSLSTKVADSIAIGKPVLVYGSDESGAISFFREHDLPLVANNKSDLKKQLIKFINDYDLQEHTYLKYKHITNLVFDKSKNNEKFITLINMVSKKYS